MQQEESVPFMADILFFESFVAECGNYQPVISVVEKLIDRRMKGNNADDDDVVRRLDAEYKLLLKNCLGKASSLPTLRRLTVDKQVIWKRQQDCVIL